LSPKTKVLSEFPADTKDYTENFQFQANKKNVDVS